MYSAATRSSWGRSRCCMLMVITLSDGSLAAGARPVTSATTPSEIANALQDERHMYKNLRTPAARRTCNIRFGENSLFPESSKLPEANWFAERTLRERERHKTVARLCAQFAATAGGDTDVLLSVHGIRTGRGIAAGG